jgi:phospholipase A1
VNPESEGGRDGCAVIGISLGIFLVVVWAFMASASASAASLETVIAPPTERPQAGKVAEFSVYVHNLGEGIASVQLPVQVSCRIESGDQTMDVVAKALEPFDKQPLVVGKNGFIKGRYGFTVPTGLSGPVRMEVREFQAASVMFAVAASDEPKTQVLGRVSSEPSEHYPTMDSLFALYQPYLANLGAYESMYFLVGTNPEKSKFQLSFKYRFLDPEGDLAEKLPWLKGLHLGYTQTSFWDLKSDSAPFEDTSYKPELFFLSSNIKKRPSWMKGFFLQTGIQHESNGRGGDFSRSTNHLYAKPFFILYDEKKQLGLQIAPKIWTYVNNDNDTNSDLEDYRGFFDLEVKIGKADGFVLESHLRWAQEGVSTQWDLTYPLHRYVFRHFGLYLQAQYVNALAESLIDYRERNKALRLGLAIVR